MEQVKPDRRSPTRTCPELNRSEIPDNGKHVFSDLEQGMGGRLQERVNTCDGAAEPDLHGHGHKPVSLTGGSAEPPGLWVPERARSPGRVDQPSKRRRDRPDGRPAPASARDP